MKVKVEEYSEEVDDYVEVEYEILGKYKYIGESDEFACINGKVYLCTDDEDDYFRVIDETNEPYVYNKKDFVKVEDDEE